MYKVVVTSLHTKNYFTQGISMPTSNNKCNQNPSHDLRREIHKLAHRLPKTVFLNTASLLDTQNNIH